MLCSVDVWNLVRTKTPNCSFRSHFPFGVQSLIYRDWGGKDIADIDLLVKTITLGNKNINIGVFGHSYGGFVALSAITRLPIKWACASVINAPSDLIKFARNVPFHWKPIIKHWLGDPIEDLEFLKERSPISHIHNIDCAIQLFHGVQDTRVSVEESDQLVEWLRLNRKKHIYYRIENEGHEFSNDVLINSLSIICKFLLLKLHVK